ncbi:DUF4394 domain-containing protein [Paracraurococcus ruber]|uniref:DUF4394 domain-containing protein n=1 Tax=Paracraurococcus ruber TaxID=77675 RepID=A0ABS1D6S7_9PROT|nr:DUF4394 domain-containing protein [Paracraurococcus ruber]MBK1662588.1 hypothetical protein [Paracraurococcus ruber]TDG13111.1 DUF4394 domain-containing protein [Paracraurococcus ruber]
MLRTTLLAGAALLAAGGAAQATTLLGLTADNHLVRIEAEGRRAAAPIRVSGTDGRLLGIDVRPSDGRLYGLTETGQIVSIDAMTGRATQVSRLPERPDLGGRATVDFNPVADRLRVLGMNGTSLRINVENGQATKDGSLKYQAGSAWAETPPRVVAGAYTNSMAGAKETMLFTVDSLTRTLNLQAPPNDGVQQPRGEIAASLPAGVAFDILSDGAGGNAAWLLAAGTLHQVDLATGKAMAAGSVAGLPAAEVIDIAAMR